jgi:hypothetical protein
MNTSATDKAGLSPVIFKNLSGKELKTVGKVPIRADDKRPSSIQFSRYDNHLIMSLSTESAREQVFEEYSDYFPSYGYLTISASTFDGGDIHDLLAVHVYPIPDSAEVSKAKPASNIDYSAVNRKVIDNAKRRRQIMKETRRKNMSVSFGLVGEAHDGESLLNGENTNLTRAIEVILEAQARARDHVSLGFLGNMITGSIDKTIAVAYNKLQFATERFEDSGLELTEMWAYLRAGLEALALEAAAGMVLVEDEVMTYINQTNFGTADPVALKDELKTEAAKVQDDILTIILAGMCFVETVCFLIFFCVKRMTTHGFKKID